MEPNHHMAFVQRNQVFQKVLVIVITLAVGFGVGIGYQKSRQSSVGLQPIINESQGKPDGIDFSVFWDVWRHLQSDFVDKDKIDTQKLVYGAIDGMVNSLGDPYTVFFPPKESKQFAEQIKGAFGGVGIELGIRDKLLTVIAPIKDTPAAKAGILAGDRIYKIDGKTTEAMKVQEAVDLIRGKNGTAVVLTIGREQTTEPKEYRLVRETIKIPSVAWKLMDGNVAYLQVFVFNENVDSQFKKAASEIAHSNATRIVLDLRDNPGGLLDSSITLAGYFLDPEKIVTIERFGNGVENNYKTEANGQLKQYPLVILINKGSASASEILAGALRDQRHSAIIGETSYGKGSVQQVSDLANGSSLKVTVAKWFTPSGLSINENGIKPNVDIQLTEDDIKNDLDPQLKKALELVKSL